MHIREYLPQDLDAMLEITVETFQPYYEQSFPELVDHEPDLVAHQHGDWRGDYRRQVPSLHDPSNARHVAVAVDDGGALLGYVAWGPNHRPAHADIEILAVAGHARRRGVAEALMNHSMCRMRAEGIRFVELGTGGDWFHAPARRLYERLGFHAIPTVAYLRQL